MSQGFETSCRDLLVCALRGICVRFHWFSVLCWLANVISGFFGALRDLIRFEAPRKCWESSEGVASRQLQSKPWNEHVSQKLPAMIHTKQISDKIPPSLLKLCNWGLFINVKRIIAADSVTPSCLSDRCWVILLLCSFLVDLWSRFPI